MKNVRVITHVKGRAVMYDAQGRVIRAQATPSIKNADAPAWEELGFKVPEDDLSRLQRHFESR